MANPGIFQSQHAKCDEMLKLSSSTKRLTWAAQVVQGAGKRKVQALEGMPQVPRPTRLAAAVPTCNGQRAAVTRGEICIRQTSFAPSASLEETQHRHNFKLVICLVLVLLQLRGCSKYGCEFKRQLYGSRVQTPRHINASWSRLNISGLAGSSVYWLPAWTIQLRIALRWPSALAPSQVKRHLNAYDTNRCRSSQWPNVKQSPSLSFWLEWPRVETSCLPLWSSQA